MHGRRGSLAPRLRGMRRIGRCRLRLLEQHGPTSRGPGIPSRPSRLAGRAPVPGACLHDDWHSGRAREEAPDEPKGRPLMTMSHAWYVTCSDCARPAEVSVAGSGDALRIAANEGFIRV